jgi:aminopeptidase N
MPAGATSSSSASGTVQSGTPTIEAKGVYDPAKKTYALTLKQSLAPTPGQPEKKPMHIPVRLGLWASGTRAAAHAGRRECHGPEERVLELTGRSRPSLSSMWPRRRCRRLAAFLRARAFQGAARPQGDRATLMARDADAFNRWEAGQTLATEVLLEMAAAAKAPRPMPIYLAAIGEVLRDAEKDPAFAAQMLLPPSESELALAMSPPIPTRSMPRAWR